MDHRICIVRLPLPALLLLLVCHHHGRGFDCPPGGIKNDSGDLCCPEECARCDASACNTTVGQSDKCCPQTIASHGVSCRNGRLPCMLRIITATRMESRCPPNSVAASNGKVCCAKQCGACGGSGCSSRPGGAPQCCSSNILEAGKYCADGGAPCIPSPSGAGGPGGNGCPGDGVMQSNGEACCPGKCGKCGGSGCSRRPGGELNCCVGAVQRYAKDCSSGELPCVLEATSERRKAGGAQKPPMSECPGDGVMQWNGEACCPGKCGKCGGDGCSERPGGERNCCPGAVQRYAKDCSSGELPCVLEAKSERRKAGGAQKPPMSECPGDGVMQWNGEACCSGKCGKCGGDGCSERPGGERNCCPGAVQRYAKDCSSGELPCVVEETNKRHENGGQIETPNPCPNDGIMEASGIACCPRHCGECGGKGCGLRPGGVVKCCSLAIYEHSPSCDNGVLPCALNRVDEASPCPDGGIMDRNAKACCPKKCGKCGDTGCSDRPGGSKNCCVRPITVVSRTCDKFGLPCLVSTPKCRRGGIVGEDGNSCCPVRCGKCGGEDCAGLPGGMKNCCVSRIRAAGRLCENSGLPCLLKPLENNCPGQGVSNKDRDTCCPKECGICRAYDCDPFNYGKSECCTGRIQEMGRFCDEVNPPCIIRKQQCSF